MNSIWKNKVFWVHLFFNPVRDVIYTMCFSMAATGSDSVLQNALQEPHVTKK